MDGIAFYTGMAVYILASAIGIDTYIRTPLGSEEDINRNIAAYGWFVFSVILAIILIVSGSLYKYRYKDVHIAWAITAWGLAIISSAMNWDLETRKRETSNDRTVWIILTVMSVSVFFGLLSTI